MKVCVESTIGKQVATTRAIQGTEVAEPVGLGFEHLVYRASEDCKRKGWQVFENCDGD